MSDRICKYHLCYYHKEGATRYCCAACSGDHCAETAINKIIDESKE